MPGKYIQGKFNPRNPKKYNGNLTNIWFLSSWELKFFQWLDQNPKVKKWSSEEIVIPYISPKDGLVHRYFPDAWAQMETKNGIKEFLIEIKPEKQTYLPKQPKRKSPKYLMEVITYAVNQAKWDAAKKFCDLQGWEFKIITEKDLGINI